MAKRASKGPDEVRWGFLGAGRMATALVDGMIHAELAKPDAITAADPSPDARHALARSSGATVLESNLEVVNRANVIVLAVKPQTMRAVLEEIRPAIGNEHLLVSVAAGVTIDTIARVLGPERRIIRVMSNTPALVGLGASAYAPGPFASGHDESLVKRMLEGIGLAEKVSESLLDAVTGLSGSGPAFVYLFIEALADGGVRCGLPRDVAIRLASQTVLGAAVMVQGARQHPAELKDQVASPGGTTIAGLHELERRAVRGAMIDAVYSATQRAAELARLAADEPHAK